MQYLKLFNSETQYNTYKTTADYVTPNICLVSGSSNVYYQKKIHSGNFYIKLSIYHPRTGALIQQYTFTFFITGELTWEECDNLIDTENTVKLRAYFDSYFNRPFFTLDPIDKEFPDGEYLPVTTYQLSDKIELNRTYEFQGM